MADTFELECPRYDGHFRTMTGVPQVWRTLSNYDLSIGGSVMSNQRFSPEFKDEAVEWSNRHVHPS